MDSKLGLKVSQGVEGVAGIKALLVLPVAALDLAVVSRRVRTDELVANVQIAGSFLKKSWNIPLAVGKTVGKLKTVVRLDTLHTDPPAGEPLHHAL